MYDYNDRLLSDTTSMSLVADVLSDAASALSGEYVYLAESSPSPEEEERLIEKSFEVHERKKATDFNDRKAMVARVREFKAELAELESPRHLPVPPT